MEVRDAAVGLTFESPDLFDGLAAASSAELDRLSFGLIAMTLDGVVVSYNACESRLAGIPSDMAYGRHFFSMVAPCTNNFMVAGRFETQTAIDEIISYVFTLRMSPTKVRLRLLKRSQSPHMFLAVERVASSHGD